ncbi:lipid A deacylase LpxR family protein [Pedobacter polaris]|uniref:Lipid A deacylase LpxR family protein n=1 Tax=Pedobacter polaris TaxID=2571273 RepID=A0A4U1CYZ6_9SPHI|nr:lipid A-modifier LpxR family protein [Pedobacter polaris]TKC12678.1 lipid A deacylase LpxR family protein [Pedobacter polaris]
MNKAIKLLILVMVLALNNKAQVSTSDIHRVGLVVDQDYFMKFVKPSLNRDLNYTMGAALPAFQYSKMAEKGWVYAPHRFLSKIFLGKSYKNHELVDAGIFLANTTFTPDYLGNLTDPGSLYKRNNDRPFASLNFIGTSVGLANATGDGLFTLSLNVGAIGLNVSNWVQTTIHEGRKGSPIPYGWEDQISIGGEPTVLLAGKKDWLLLGKADGRGYFQLSSNAELRAGYYTSTGIGLNTRIGLLDTRNWMVNTLPLGNATKRLATQKNLSELYLMGGVKANAWIYNALLMGQFKANKYEMSFSELRKGTLDWNIGVGGKIPFSTKKALRLSAMAVGRSPEFKTVSEFERWHSWVNLQAYYEW